MDIIIAIVLATTWFLGLFLGNNNARKPQNLIEQFDKPVCVEKIVGKDTIKKCYELKEIPRN